MKRKTKAQLEKELAELRRKMAELDASRTKSEQADTPLPHERGGFEQYLDVLGVIVVFLDTEGRIALINKRGREAFGYEDKDIRGENWFELCVPPELRKKARGVFRMLVAGATDSVEYYEGRVLTKAGGVRTILWHGTATTDAEGRFTGVLCSGEDITDRKRTEEALRESQERYRRLVELSPDTICVHTEGKIAFINAAGARLLGAAGPEELVERPIMEFLHPDYRETVVERIREMGESGSRVSLIEEKFIRLDGKEVDVEVAAIPSTYQGKPAVQVVVRNITDRKRLEKEILDISARERRRIGEDLHDGLGQHLTDVSLLSKVLAQKLAAESSPSSAEAAKIGELIRQAASWTRDLARAAHPVDPAPEGLMSALQAMASSEEELPGVSCVFRCDRPILIHDNSVATHLYRMAREALSNAVRHGRAEHVEIGLARVEGGVRLEVTDDGLGIPEPLEEDKGMGLRIMAYRARMIGGALEIRRRPTGGALVACTVRSGP